MILIIGLFSVLFNLAGCNNDNIISEDKLVKIYTDLIIEQDTSKSAPPDLSKLRDKIFSRYRVTEKQYDATIDYYNRNPKEWQKFFKKAISYADKLKQKSDI